jgi:hypothetical protein
MDNDFFLKEALQIVERAKANDICLRILGALAVYISSLDNAECTSLFLSLGRLGEGNPLFTDVDLAGYRKQRKQIVKLFEEMQFKPMGMLNVIYGDKRLIYSHPNGSYSMDIFLDKLEFSHDVSFGKEPSKGRLELSYPTVSLADIVLEKLQIHRINRKDLVDLVVLFLGHDISEGSDSKAVDGRYITNVLSNDWGFWYDASMNLGKVKTLVEQFLPIGKITDNQSKVILERVDQLSQLLEGASKTKNWEKRSKVGTKKPWYRDVDEVER